jgi:hypothetical protein
VAARAISETILVSLAIMVSLRASIERAPAEGREQSGVDDVVSGDRELGVQTAHEVEDELRLRNGVTDIVKRVSEGHHALTVVGDGGVTLNKSMKLIAEVDRTRLLVVVEEIEDGCVKGTSRLIIGTHGEGEDGVFDIVVESALDGVVGLRPHQIRGTCRDVWIKVGKKSKLPHHGPEEGAPAGEIRAGEFQGDRHVGFDVDGGKRVEDDWSNVGGERARRESVAGC